MRMALALTFVSGLLLSGCGEPKTVKMDRMHAVNSTGIFFVEGTVDGINKSLTVFKSGDIEYKDLTLRDDTGTYTFYFLPSDHTRQPAAGDNVKMHVRFVILDQSFAGGGRAPIVQQFEFK